MTETPPGPKGLPVLGNTHNYVIDPLGFLYKTAQRYGDLVHYNIGRYQIYLVNNPELIKEVLVAHPRNFHKGAGTEYLAYTLGQGLLTNEGESHLRQRRLVQPAFHRQRIASYGKVMTEYAARTSRRWRDGAKVDMHREMMSLTLGVVGKTLFDSDLQTDRRVISQALTAFMDWWWWFVFPFADLIHKLPLRVNRRYEVTSKKLNELTYRLINEHRKAGKDRGDLLSMLLIAQDTEGDGGRMTDKQVRDETVTLIMAGHETTANALTWAWYLLSQNPEAQAKLHAELDEVLGGRLPTLEDLPRLRYTEMVFSETIRMYPPAWGIGRKVLNDFELGGYTIPAGAVIVMVQYAMHHDPRYYPEPFKFKPERWTPEEKAKRPKFSYFPFGGGNRICIGEQFAWMEGVLILATLAQQWEARLAQGHKVKTEPLVTLRPKNGMPMLLQRRKPGRSEQPGAETLEHPAEEDYVASV